MKACALSVTSTCVSLTSSATLSCRMQTAATAWPQRQMARKAINDKGPRKQVMPCPTTSSTSRSLPPESTPILCSVPGERRHVPAQSSPCRANQCPQHGSYHPRTPCLSYFLSMANGARNNQEYLDLRHMRLTPKLDFIYTNNIEHIRALVGPDSSTSPGKASKAPAI